MNKEILKQMLHISMCYIFLFGQMVPLAYSNSLGFDPSFSGGGTGGFSEPAIPENDDPDFSLPDIQGELSGYISDSSYVTERGTLNYQIPIDLPEGIGGMKPQLKLSYDSRGGNGILGMGWSLSGLSSISLCSSTLAQDGYKDGVDFDEYDKFCLDGQRLVVVNNAPYGGPAEYRTENEIFSRITMDPSIPSNGGYNGFEARTKDGMRYVYGYTHDSRIEAQNRSDALSWNIHKIIDTQADDSGNAIYFKYFENQSEGENYIDEINYGGNDSAGISSKYKVKFVYEDRPDIITRYVSGSKVSTRKRLTNIEVFYENSLYKSYNFTFEQSGATRRSKLKKVQYCAKDGTCMRPTEFQWKDVANKLAYADLGSTGGSQRWAQGNWNPESRPHEIVDFTGDGISDALSFQTDGLYLWKSTGSTFLAPFKLADGNWHPTHRQHALGDITGDGLIDIISFQRDGLYVWKSNGSSLLAPELWSVHDWSLHPTIQGKEILDYTGDGIADFIAYSQYGLYLFESTGTGFRDRSTLIHTNFSPQYRNPEFIDITGDGKLNVVTFQYEGLYKWNVHANAQVDYEQWHHIIWSPQNRPHGLGHFYGTGIVDVTVPQHDGFHVFSSNGKSFNDPLPWSTENWAPNHRTHGVVDVNSDGYDDLVSYEASGLWVRQSKGDGFLPAVRWSTENWSPSLRNAEAADVTGDGKADFISFQNDGLYVWPTTYGVSDTIVKITNGHGKETHITYTPMTNPAVYNKVADPSVYPGIQIQSPLTVVTTVQQSNGLGGLNYVTYSYNGLFYSLDGRGFCGFKSITSVDHATKFQTLSIYEQAHPYKSLLKSKTVFSPTGVVLSFEVNTWDHKVLNGGKNYFVYERSRYSDERTLSGEFIRARSVTTDVDDYGNTTNILEADNVGNTTTTTNTYENNITGVRWHLGRLVHSSVLKYAVGQAALRRESKFEYDPSSGRLIKEIIEPNHNELSLAKIYQIDNFGNIYKSTVEGPNILTRVTETHYDNNGRFLTETINPIGHTENREYFEDSGLVKKVTNANNLSSTYSYDSFDRKKLETSPLGTKVRTLNLMADANAPANAVHMNRVDKTDGSYQITYYDLLDREIRAETRSFDGRRVLKDKEYNTKGELVRESEPYFFGETPLWTEYSYDTLSREIKITQPGNRVSNISYGPLSVTTVNPLNQEVTRVSNVLGQEITVRDNLGNEIFYTYDSYGNLTSTLDAYGNEIKATYDIRGNRIRIDDPDFGTVYQAFDALGNVLESVNHVQELTEYTYDSLSRMIKRVDSSGEITEWEYDTGQNGKGFLTKILSNGYERKYQYDSFSRVKYEDTKIDNISARFGYNYDSHGRIDKLNYPENFSLKYNYDENGFMQSINQVSDNKLLWELKEQDARGNITEFSLGNNLITNKQYDNATGFLNKITTGAFSSDQIQNLGVTFDALGNLLSRSDLNRNLTETLTYDSLNRLKNSDVSGFSISLDYDDLGNIIYKSDVGTYSYGENGAGPHAVTTIIGEKSNNYSYDLKGNRVSGLSEDITYTSFNKPNSIVKNGANISFTYGPERQRIKQVKSGGIKNFTRYYFGGNYQIEEADGSITHKHFVSSPEGLIAINTVDSSSGSGSNFSFGGLGDNNEGSSKLSFIHKDHLGSTQTVTDENGNVLETLSYDAWGVRRNAEDWLPTSEPIMSSIDQGFTGHEHLDDVDLVHMGGRVYDPVIGRFLSPDPHIQESENLQNLNRYSYVLNNPLSFTDPSGFFFKKLFRAILKPFRKLLRNPYIRAIVTVVLIANGINPLWLSGFQAAETLANGGSLLDIAKSAAISVATSGAFDIVGGAFESIAVHAFNSAHVAKIISHGLVGGARSVIQGGKFQHGFFSAAAAQTISPALGSHLSGDENKSARIYISAVVGGTASKLSGGSFANGAVTAAYARLYNDEAHNVEKDYSINNLDELIENHGTGRELALKVTNQPYGTVGAVVNTGISFVKFFIGEKQAGNIGLHYADPQVQKILGLPATSANLRKLALNETIWWYKQDNWLGNSLNHHDRAIMLELFRGYNFVRRRKD